MCRFHNVISNWRFTLYITDRSVAGLMLLSLEISKCLLPHEQVEASMMLRHHHFRSEQMGNQK